MEPIPYKKILNELTALISVVAAELDVTAFYVGGGLRDALLGRETNDSDFALSGAVEVLPHIFAAKAGGKFFWLDEKRLQSRVVIMHEGKPATFDFAPLQGHNIEEDLLLRDFTINALALPVSPTELSIVDPLNGMGDMRRGVIRACSGKTFDNDPLRLLRAFRFEAVLGFAIDASTWRDICDRTHLVRKSAAERKRDELFRILATSNAAVTLERLNEARLLGEILPRQLVSPETVRNRIDSVSEIERTIYGLCEFPAGIGKNVLDCLSLELESGLNLLSILKLAAFIGNTGTGSELLTEIAVKLKLGGRTRKALNILVGESDADLVKPGKLRTKRSFYRFFRDHEPAGLSILLAAFSRKLLSPELCSSILGYYFDEYGNESEDTLLSGDEIMEIMGIGPGTAVGEAVNQLKHAESIGLVNCKAEAREFVVKNLLTKC